MTTLPSPQTRSPVLTEIVLARPALPGVSIVGDKQLVANNIQTWARKGLVLFQSRYSDTRVVGRVFGCC